MQTSRRPGELLKMSRRRGLFNGVLISETRDCMPFLVKILHKVKVPQLQKHLNLRKVTYSKYFKYIFEESPKVSCVSHFVNDEKKTWPEQWKVVTKMKTKSKENL